MEIHELKELLKDSQNIPFEIDDKLLAKAILKLDEMNDGALPHSKSVIIYGSPKAWKRHRASKFSGMYDPNTPEKKIIQAYFDEEFKGIPMIQGEIRMFIKAYRPIPKTMPKYLSLLYEAKLLKPLGRPDVDNFIKLIQDALNGVIYRDDSQITKIISEKYLSFTPRTEIVMQWA